MGGAYSGINNNRINASTADWNFFVDPEGAHVVLKSFTRKIFILTKETGLANRISFQWRYKVFGELKKNSTALNLLTQADKKIYANIEGQKWGPSDALLAAVFVDRKLIKEETKYSNGTVELNGWLTRGQLILTKFESANLGNITIIKTVDLEGFKKILLQLRT